MAAPHVTGAVALLLAAGAPRDPKVIKNALQSTARTLPDDIPNFNGGNRYGAGLLDVYSALLPYADPTFSVGLVGDLQLGSTYSPTQKPLTIRAVGVTKAPAVGAVTIEIQTATTPASVVRTLRGGN